MKFEGLDELINNVEKMSKSAEELDGEHKVSFDDLFTKSFMHKYTNFSTIDELFKAGNFEVNSQEDFEAISNIDLDKHIVKATKFSSWEDMLNKARELYIVKKLSL